MMRCKVVHGVKAAATQHWRLREGGGCVFGYAVAFSPPWQHWALLVCTPEESCHHHHGIRAHNKKQTFQQTWRTKASFPSSVCALPAQTIDPVYCLHTRHTNLQFALPFPPSSFGLLPNGPDRRPPLAATMLAAVASARRVGQASLQAVLGPSGPLGLSSGSWGAQAAAQLKATVPGQFRPEAGQAAARFSMASGPAGQPENEAPRLQTAPPSSPQQHDTSRTDTGSVLGQVSAAGPRVARVCVEEERAGGAAANTTAATGHSDTGRRGWRWCDRQKTHAKSIPAECTWLGPPPLCATSA